MKTKEKTKEQKTPDVKAVILETTKELLDLLGVSADIKVELSEEIADVTLQTDEGGIIIGYHGEGLEALQLILSLAVSKKLENFQRISLEVGDYKKNRIDFLKNLALSTKQKVVDERREFSLTNLKPWERKIVHTFLQEDQEVMSESQGEGKDRVLVIKLK